MVGVLERGKSGTRLEGGGVQGGKEGHDSWSCKKEDA